MEEIITSGKPREWHAKDKNHNETYFFIGYHKHFKVWFCNGVFLCKMTEITQPVRWFSEVHDNKVLARWGLIFT